MRLRLLAALATVTLISPVSLLAAPQPAVPVSTLVRAVDIPHQSFTLPNGLRVFVHEDHKAPVVAVSIWYHVGSKDEPAGKTGFAHLFEHLMFSGSENAPGSFMEPLQQVGATDLNGSTWFDRTNYFETVPTPALPRALFLEADRMGHLLGAIDQGRLDNQRGVVQNEKRQGDNEPYGLVEYAQQEALFPEGHPYRHTTIGSMADLDKASLADVKDWFRSHYGPNNAVLVLAGDIDLATARTLVTRYFGGIPRGPQNVPAAASVPTLPSPKSETLKDQVATTRIYRMWAVPGLTAADTVPLDMAATVLGGLSSSRLDNALVRGEKIAVSVSADVQPFERVGTFEVTADVKPGVDPALVAKRLDAIIADFLKTGPSADEVQRVATREVAGRIRGLESVGGFGGKAVAIAEGVLYADDADFYKKQLATYASATPARIKAAADKWLSRPVYALTVAPGERSAYDEAKAGSDGVQAGDKLPPTGAAKAAQPAAKAKLPDVGTFADLKFPAVSHAKLSNGIDVTYAQRTAVPVTRVVVSFDAGNAADPKDKLGLQSLMLALLDEGTPTRSSIQIAEEQERLGAAIGAGASMDRTTLSLTALSPNLAPSLDLFADILRNPAFAPAAAARRSRSPRACCMRATPISTRSSSPPMPPLLYGRAHPYGIPFTGTGDPKVVASVGRDDMIAFQHEWLRPDTARIFVVSDQPLASLTPLLEARFGGWRVAGVKGVKNLGAPTPLARGRIVLIDRPGTPQSLILAGELLPLTGTVELLPLIAANDVLGGSFLSRLNSDLREKKGWAYGVNSSVNRVLGTVPYIISAPVQSDKTGPAIAAMRGDLAAYLTRDGTTEAELMRTVNNSIRELPGSFETGSQVLGGMQRNALLGRPDDYYDTLAARYRALKAADLDKAARDVLDPDKLLWVVVGDGAKVRPQLDALKLPVESASPAAK